jgi:hypothetical protein
MHIGYIAITTGGRFLVLTLELVGFHDRAEALSLKQG